MPDTLRHIFGAILIIFCDGCAYILQYQLSSLLWDVYVVIAGFWHPKEACSHHWHLCGPPPQEQITWGSVLCRPMSRDWRPTRPSLLSSQGVLTRSRYAYSLFYCVHGLFYLMICCLVFELFSYDILCLRLLILLRRSSPMPPRSSATTWPSSAMLPGPPPPPQAPPGPPRPRRKPVMAVGGCRAAAACGLLLLRCHSHGSHRLLPHLPVLRLRLPAAPLPAVHRPRWANMNRYQQEFSVFRLFNLLSDIQTQCQQFLLHHFHVNWCTSLKILAAHDV
jgi:hypothetical protein